MNLCALLHRIARSDLLTSLYVLKNLVLALDLFLDSTAATRVVLASAFCISATTSVNFSVQSSSLISSRTSSWGSISHAEDPPTERKRRLINWHWAVLGDSLCFSIKSWARERVEEVPE